MSAKRDFPKDGCDIVDLPAVSLVWLHSFTIRMSENRFFP
jgi:hypothetical protein